MRRLFRTRGAAGARAGAHRVTPHRVERLEPRTLLAFAPVGPEFQVNTTSVGNQGGPAMAADADGDFVLAWFGPEGIFARRFAANGLARGAEFLVSANPATPAGARSQNPAIAVDADGDFVVTWDTTVITGGATLGIHARRYNAAGDSLGGEFQVNTAANTSQRTPAVAADADGDFVVAWMSGGLAGSRYDIYARRFSAAGVPQGAEFRASTTVNGNEQFPSVAADADGDFVVAWHSYDIANASAGNDVYAQRYSAAGAALGGTIPVNTTSVGQHADPAVALDADGDFVITWTVAGPTDQDVYARQFSPAGVGQGAEFLVNATTAEVQRASTVAADADGDFVIAWHGREAGVYYDAYARRYNAAGAALGGEFRLNTYTAQTQVIPVVAMDADGDAVAAWISNGQDGDQGGLFAQRFDETTDADGPIVTAVSAAGDQIAANERLVSVIPQLAVNFSENLSTLGGAAGANSVTNPANWALTRDGVAVPAIHLVTFGFNTASNKYEAVLMLSPAQADGSYVLTAKGNLRDVGGNTLDGNFDGAPGGDFSRPFVVDLPLKVGPEFRVNTATANSQENPAVAMTPAGGFVVAWTSTGQSATGWGAYAQRYNAAGVPQGGQIPVSTFPSFYTQVAVAADAAGNFVVAWMQANVSGSEALYYQRFNADGVAQDNSIIVDSGIVNRPHSLAMDPNGNFVLAWTRLGSDGFDVLARRYNAAGAPQGLEFRVNTFTTNYQFDPSVAMDADGDFVVAYVSRGQDAPDYGVYARRYSAGGLAQGTEFPVNVVPTTSQLEPSVASDADGDFVVAWQSHTQDGSGYGVYARRFSAAGAARTPEFRVNTFTAGNQIRPSVASDADGDFVVAWQSESQDGSGTGVYAQRYNAAGVPQGDEFRVNTHTPDPQHSPSVASDADGDFVVAWTSTFQDGSGYGIYAQCYAANQRPTTLGIPSVTVAEDEADTLIDLRPFFADSTDAPAGLALSVVSNSNPALFSSASISAATGVLTLDYAPDANGEAQLTVRATDSGGLSVDSTFTVTVNPVNDAPVNHVPDPQFPERREPVVFGTRTGNAITVTDVDADDARVVVTLRFPRGTRVRLAPSGGIAVLEETEELLSFRGRLEDVNAALNGMTVTPEEERGDEIPLTITTDDGGATGAGGPMSDTDVVSIVYNPQPPLLNVRDVTLAEGNAGTTAAVFTVSFKGAPLAGQTVRVHYATADGTATAAGGDYVPLSGLLEFAPGENEKTVTVLVNGELDPELDETFFLNLSAPQYAILNDPQGVATINDDDTPPRVAAVFFNGTRWTTAFRNGLAAAGRGDALLGFAFPTGQPLAPLSWDGIDQVSIRFDRDVVLLQGDLDIRGAMRAYYPTSRMTYNAAARTATWTLPAAFQNDKLLLDLNGDPGGVRNSGGLRLDGEGSGAAFPSGDGVQGGDFRFRFDVLTGDANRDGRVNATDVLDVRRRLRRSTTSPGSGPSGYNPFGDLTADGVIGAADEAQVRRYAGRSLPAGEPAPAAVMPAASSRRVAPVTRGFFGEAPILSSAR